VGQVVARANGLVGNCIEDGRKVGFVKLESTVEHLTGEIAVRLEDVKTVSVDGKGEGDLGLWMGVGVSTSLACTGGESMK